MSTKAHHSAIAATSLLLATALTNSFAYAQCGCPSGGGDAPKAASGLGLATPNTLDLVTDPAWQVYEFERDGIRYIQINDISNNIRAAVGQIGSAGWVLPIGLDADKVSIQTQSQSVIGRIIYSDDSIEIYHYRQSNQNRWIIIPKDSP